MESSLKTAFEISLIQEKKLDDAVIFALGLRGTTAAAQFKDYVKKYAETAQNDDRLGYLQSEYMNGYKPDKVIKTKAAELFTLATSETTSLKDCILKLEKAYVNYVPGLTTDQEKLHMCFMAFDAVAENERKKVGLVRTAESGIDLSGIQANDL